MRVPGMTPQTWRKTRMVTQKTAGRKPGHWTGIKQRTKHFCDMLILKPNIIIFKNKFNLMITKNLAVNIFVGLTLCDS